MLIVEKSATTLFKEFSVHKKIVRITIYQTGRGGHPVITRKPGPELHPRERNLLNVTADGAEAAAFARD